MIEILGLIIEIIKLNHEIIVAFSALFVAIYSLHLSSKHNRISIMPYLEVKKNFNLNYTNSEPSEILLENKGLGSAFVTKIDLRLNGKNVDVDNQEIVRRNIDELLKKICGQVGYKSVPAYSLQILRVTKAKKSEPLFVLEKGKKIQF